MLDGWNEVSTIGVDIAKSVFQIHGVDAGGTVVIRRRVGRARVLEFFADLPPCLVEACATAHQWAREVKKLGHDTRLMPPTYVKAYVKRGKNDARFACQAIVTQLHAVQIEISGLDKRITQTHRVNADSKRLDTIPGFGVILSTAVVATMTDPKAFKTGREFAAWIGLVPRQNSTGGKDRLGSISKQGDRYLRRLLVVAATSVINSARARPYKYPWVIELLGRRPTKVVAVALANDGADRLGRAGQGRAVMARSPPPSTSAL